MRAGMCAAISLAAIAAGWVTQPARAQDNPSPEQMKKMYDDALQQLKAAQERKNQLAAENEKLKQQIDAMNKDLAAVRTELDSLRVVDAAHAERTFFLRSHYMAWQSFAKMYPETGERWQLFLESAYLLSPKERVSLLDREWPAGRPQTQPATSATSPADTQPSTTQAATAPAATAPAATAPAAAPATTAPATTGPDQDAPKPSTAPAVPATPSTAPTTGSAQKP